MLHYGPFANLHMITIMTIYICVLYSMDYSKTKKKNLLNKCLL